MREKALEIPRQLLHILDNQTISQTNGLIVEDIPNLPEELKEGKKYDRKITLPFLFNRLRLVAQVFDALAL
ncbi:hypothetical protein QUA13_13395 [Microcoleus sp. S28C3]|uniref:hypothetical protein n=1 Tax=Microcoleus sp. S28C3 TaxID=3055414 RepID=UPI002FD514B0